MLGFSNFEKKKEEKPSISMLFLSTKMKLQCRDNCNGLAFTDPLNGGLKFPLKINPQETK
jgi:hypothetical protein